MTTDELDRLVRRANKAGYDSIPDYAQHLVNGLRQMADGHHGIYGRWARKILDGKDGP